jgi:hypothetical protein
MPQSFVKDPDAVKDYVMGWATWLADDTISSSVWTLPDGITKDSDTNTTTTATIWLSGGSDGHDYVLLNHIVTAADREEEDTITIRVRDKAASAT